MNWKYTKTSKQIYQKILGHLYNNTLRLFDFFTLLYKFFKQIISKFFCHFVGFACIYAKRNTHQKLITGRNENFANFLRVYEFSLGGPRAFLKKKLTEILLHSVFQRNQIK
jgi:hypothetical protein